MANKYQIKQKSRCPSTTSEIQINQRDKSTRKNCCALEDNIDKKQLHCIVNFKHPPKNK